MRKILEQENICNSLKGRIQYFQTRYRDAHDQTSRIAIRLDGKEVFKSDVIIRCRKPAGVVADLF